MTLHEFDNYDARTEDEGIKTRVTMVEKDTQAILQRLDREMATKADLERAVATVVKWIVGSVLGSLGLTVTIMTFVLNYAPPPQGRFARAESAATAAAPVQPPAIIINIPPGALQWQPAPEGAQTSPRKP
jgi:hypothetical protein